MASYDDTATVSGSVVSFPNGADDVPTKSLVVTIPPTLSGVSSVTETQTGKNLLEVTGTAVSGDLTVTPQADGTVVVNGQRSSALTWNAGQFVAKGACSIVFSGCSGGSGSTYSVNIQKNNVYQADVYNGDSIAYNLVQGDVIKFIVVVRANVSMSNVVFSPMIRFSAVTDGTFEKYAETQYTASLGRTIYGGTADIVNGQGTESYGRIIFDGSNDEFWQKHGSIASWFYIDNAITDGYVNNAENDFMICNLGTQAKYASVAQLSNGQFAFGRPSPTTYRFVFKNTDFTEVTDFKAWLSNNNMQVVYKLATPTDFTFDGQEVPTRLGYNAFWSEQGDTELTYYKSGYGFTSVTVNKTGKNLFDISKVATTGTTAGISWSVSGNEITISGTATSSGWKTFVEFKLPHKGTYHFHMNATGNVGYFLRGWTQLVGKDVTEVCNDPSQVYRIAIAVTTAGQTYEGTISEIQIEVGDAYTSYEPYEAVSKTAYLHKVIYGGQADVVKGTAKPKNLLDASTGRGTGTIWYYYDNGILLEKDKSYTLSCGNRGSGSISFYGIDHTTQLAYSYIDNSSASVTFTSTENVYVCPRIYQPGLTPETVVEPQLEVGDTPSEFVPHFEPFSFPPISMETDEGENTLFANEGASAITYRKETD